MELSWDGSTAGRTEVDHYNVYHEGTKVAEWASTFARVAVPSGEVHVTAVDVAGKESEPSNTVAVDGPDTGPVERGTYRIQAVHSGKSLDVADGSTSAGASVVQNSTAETQRQHWHVEPTDYGPYRIENANSGLVLDIYEASTSDGADTIQWSDNGADNQRFYLEDTGDGAIRIEAAHSGKVLEVEDGSTADGANVHQWSEDGGAYQRWRFESV